MRQDSARSAETGVPAEVKPGLNAATGTTTGSVTTVISQFVKPAFLTPCNSCGYCCAVRPCALANEFLNCDTGPCVALEWTDGKSGCGLVRNPLGYLYQAVHPGENVPVLELPTAVGASSEFSKDL